MKLLIKNGRVIDPANNIDGVLDILVDDKKISKVAPNIQDGAADVIDAQDKIVIPGLFDMHVHLREPGREDKETVSSATDAALKGGVTRVLAMPNTTPAIDSVESIRLLKGIIEKTARAEVNISVAITKGRLGKELTDIRSLKKEGVLALTDDGSSVDDDELMYEALIQAKKNGILIISHCEDKRLSCGGVVNLGFMSTKLGLRGISRESEYLRIQRDIQLAGKSGAPLHIAHVSLSESVEVIAKAKKKGIRVSAETCPHYFSLTEDLLSTYDANLKMNPPLRTKEDLLAIKQGLRDGTLDVIASDHAPHTENEKDIEFDRAEFGVIGLETLLSVSITELIKDGLSWPDLIRKFTVNPAKILGVCAPSLAEGESADIAIIDPDKEWIVRKEKILSKSKNSPFIGMRLKGVVQQVIYEGEILEVTSNQ